MGIFRHHTLTLGPSILHRLKMNSIARVSNTVRVMGTRRMGTGQIQPGYEKTGGDRVLYYTTAFLTVAGVAMSFKFFYDASFPKKGFNIELETRFSQPRLECK